MSVTETEMVRPKQQSLIRATSLVSLLTFISRILGFVRDMVLAGLFGAEAGMDAFFVAFRIPNFMRRLFAEGAFSQAFVPVLAEYQQTKSFDDVRSFIARIAGQLFSVLFVFTILGVLASPIIIFIFAPGFADSMRFSLATEMLRITFPYLMLVSLTAMSGALLNTYGYFGVPAITPVFLNVAMICAALYLSPHLSTPVVALAWGVFLAGVIQFLFQLPFLLRRNLLVRPRFVRKDEGVKRVLKLMVPALFGVSIAQLNLMIDSIFASFLKVGSVSWLYFTDRLTDFPLGVFGVAIATVILPQLSRNVADNNQDNYSKALNWGLQAILLIGIPAAVGLTFFSMPLIAACFAYGAFTPFDLLQTQKSLLALGAGVPAFMLVKVLASGFYASQNIKTPVKVGAIAMLVNSVLCALFIWPLAHAGLALASTVAGYVNCALLMILLKKRQIFVLAEGWGKFLIQLLFSNSILAVYLFCCQGELAFWLGLGPGLRLLYLMVVVAGAVVLYLFCLYLLGMRIAQFRGRVKG